MKIAFTLLLVLLVQVTQAQLTVSTNNISWSKSSAGNSSTDYDTSYTVRNTGFSKITAKWLRMVDNMPTGWSTEVCDLNNCYSAATSTDTCTIQHNFGGPFILHVFPNGIAGSAKIKLKIWDASDTNDVQITTFNISVGNVGLTTVQQHIPLTVQYNSMARHIVVKGFQDAGIQLVEIYNMLGEKMMSTSLYNNGSNTEATVDVTGLQSGVYFARLISSGNQTVITKKFIR